MRLSLETTLNDGLHFRSATKDDAASVARIIEAHHQHWLGSGSQTPEQVLADWVIPGFDVETDVQLVVTADDVVVGYMPVWNMSPPYIANFTSLRVDPDYLGQGIGTTLTRWAIERAQEKIPLAPEDAQITIAATAYQSQTGAQELLEREGFRMVRHWYQMRIDMDTSPPSAQFPDHISITTYAELGDLMQVVRAYIDGFRDHYGFIEKSEETYYEDLAHWIETNPYHDDDLWLLAMDGDEIAGFCLSQSKTDEDPDMAYIQSLAVRREWRKQGIALNLLYLTFGKLYEQGIRKASLRVDAESLTGATRLYEKAGMYVYRRSDRYEKVLREGKDYRTVD